MRNVPLNKQSIVLNKQKVRKNAEGSFLIQLEEEEFMNAYAATENYLTQVFVHYLKTLKLNLRSIILKFIHSPLANLKPQRLMVFITGV